MIKTKCDAVKIESNKKIMKYKELVKHKNTCHGTYWFYASI